MEDRNKTKMLVPEIHEREIDAIGTPRLGLTFWSSIKVGPLALRVFFCFEIPRFRGQEP